MAVAGAGGKPGGVLPEGGGKDGAQALVPVAQPVREAINEELSGEFSPQVMRLPVEVDVTVPVREFRVRHLLALVPGEVIEAQWSNGSDLPLAAGEVQLAWTEFEVVDSKLAVRVTRVA
jgi:flagellar motor switch protein FliM